MPVVTEIAPGLYRISTFLAPFNLQFNQFLVKDEEPLLFHTGLRALFPAVKEAVAGLLDLSKLRWIAFSHFEADECGALNDWLELAPAAEPVCSFVGAMVSVNDVSIRKARAMKDDEVLGTGTHRMRFIATPHVPHAWDAGLMFDEASGTLLCSDLFHQDGDVEAATESDVVERARTVLIEYQAGPFANYLPYTPQTDGTLRRLAEMRPKVCATMHGSAFVGDGERALRDLAVVYREVLGGP